MRPLRVAVIGVLTGIVAWSASPGLAAATRVNTPSATCGTTWAIVPSPSAGNDGSSVGGVSAISSSDAWAVGGYTDRTPAIITTPFILHWDGTAWAQVPSNSTPGSKGLSDVVEISSSDAWAVGLTFGLASQPYAEHWDGTAWSEASLPTPGSSAVLNGVTATSSSDVWAVGFSLNDALGRNQTLIEHWDGTSWNIVASPNLGSDPNYLGDVTAVSANDVWASGNTENGLTQIGQPILEHWDGQTWSLVRAWRPKTSTDSLLEGIGSNASGSVFSTGHVFFPTDGIFAEDWSGTRWQPLSVVSPPDVNTLFGVAVNAAGEAWIVGHTAKTGRQDKTLIEHSSGSIFVRDLSANVAGAASDLVGAGVSPDGDVWAVGYSTLNGFPPTTLIEHLCP